MRTQPIIFHLDMNSYFASVAQQENPAYRGRPLGVCEHLGGIIIAASIEAKRWGIKTGTPVWEAKKLYPKIILARTLPERYRFYTRRFLKLMREYSALVEPYSIDEAFMDASKACNIRKFSVSLRGARALSGDEAILTKQKIASSSRLLMQKGEPPRNDMVCVNPFDEALNIAREIKRRMKSEVGDYLTCSIGIAENKLLAKIGSDMQKPDGIVVISHKGHPCAAQGCPLWLAKDDLYARLKLTDIPGIGRRQEKNLNALGIRTFSELRDYPKSHLVARFGPIGGHHLYNLGQLKASWKAPVLEDREIKSIGHMYTLPQKYRQERFFKPVLYKLCEMVARRLRRKKLAGNIIHVYCHDKNYRGFGQSLKLNYCLRDGREIFLLAQGLLAGRLRGSGGVDIKLIGVTVAGLRHDADQLSLFGHSERQRRLLLALDTINDKYGDGTIGREPAQAAKDAFQDSVGFGRIKEL